MSKTQSTYDLTQFKPTTHFEERALERFNVPATQLKKFLKDSSPVYDTYLATFGNRIQAMSRTGNMFVLNPDTKELITVFKSISPKIAESKQKAFQNELNNMIGRYQLLTAQAYIQAIAENITRFNNLSQNLLNEKPSQLNFAMVEQIYKDVTVIKSTLNLLTKQNDYYQGHSSTYNPFEQLNFEPIDDHFDQPKSFDVPITNIAQLYPESLYKIGYDPETGTNKTNNNPVNYQPKITNRDVLQAEKPLMDQLTAEQKQSINNWVNKIGKSQLAGQIIKAIKQGLTKTQLLKSVKSQMKLVDYNNFNSLITKMIKENN